MGNRRINIAASYVGTRALGPGLRSVVWVQGCPFNCQGCISPDWIPNKITTTISIEDLSDKLLSNPLVDGFVFSGGEPFLQAESLAELIIFSRRERDLTLICYSGFSFEELEINRLKRGIGKLLAEVDVLIDGKYVASLNDNRGLRGSNNQRVHHLTDRLKYYDFETQPRQTEIYVQNGELLFVGVPPTGLITPIEINIPIFPLRILEPYERA